MLLEIHEVLKPEQVHTMRKALLEPEWVDGNQTSGHQSALAKRNRQLPENSPVAQECGKTILKALQGSGLFMSAALPQRVFPPLFNRYEGGEHFANHVDNAIRALPMGGRFVRICPPLCFFRIRKTTMGENYSSMTPTALTR